MSCHTSHHRPTGLSLQFSFSAEHPTWEHAILDRLQALFVVAFLVEPCRRVLERRHEVAPGAVALSRCPHCLDAANQESCWVGLTSLGEQVEGFRDGDASCSRFLLQGVSLIHPVDLVSRNLANRFVRFGGSGFPTQNRFWCFMFCTVL